MKASFKIMHGNKHINKIEMYEILFHGYLIRNLFGERNYNLR